VHAPALLPDAAPPVLVPEPDPTLPLEALDVAPLSVAVVKLAPPHWTTELPTATPATIHPTSARTLIR